MPATNEKLREVSYHESGHAVVAWRLGLKFLYVTIKPDGECLGHVKHRQSPRWLRNEVEQNRSDRARMYAERHIITGYAGQIAHARLIGKAPRFGMPSDGAASDMEDVAELAALVHYPGETWRAYLRYCFLASRDLVTRDFPNIERVAAALIEGEGTLSYEDVIEAIMPGSRAMRMRLKARQAAGGMR
jgi:hypothetical protein